MSRNIRKTMFQWLLNPSDSCSDSCGNHHFESWQETDDIKVVERTYVWSRSKERFGGMVFKGYIKQEDSSNYPISEDFFTFLKRQVSTCEHEGCEEQKERWIAQKTIHKHHIDKDEVPVYDIDDLRNINPFRDL